MAGGTLNLSNWLPSLWLIPRGAYLTHSASHHSGRRRGHPPAHGPGGHSTGSQPPSPVTAELLTQVITGQGEIPGRLDDGTMDCEALSTWVNV